MELIIAEKAIAGKRIASILAGKQVSVRMADGAQLFEIASDRLLVPLSGHVMDVEFPKEYTYWRGTDLKQLCVAEILYLPTAPAIIRYLKRIAPQVSRVVIATDADREGESIGLEALRALNEGNQNMSVKRAYFSALTEKDIKPAFEHLREFDYPFADSADVRREIDLVWGAVLTRYLSLVSGRMGTSFLSAGRVQIPTLALVVQREKERQAFQLKPYWEVHAEFEKNGSVFSAEHRAGRFWEKKVADAVMAAEKPPQATVMRVSRKQRTLARPLPFNTTGYLRAATALGVSASRAMSIAESLYQAGYTSYPRTDNMAYPKTLDLGEILAALARHPPFFPVVESIVSRKALVPSSGKETKDHPPIHPVSLPDKAKLNAQEWLVFELIARRFLATLGEDAVTENVLIDLSLNQQPFVARGQVFLKKAWKDGYPYSETTEVFLPALATGDVVQLNKLEQVAKETQPPARYSEGSLIKLMEDHGLGTKATRHTIIQKLFSRKYLVGPKSLVPSTVAFAVISVLEKYSPSLVRPKMTADLEHHMDLVAAGKKSKAETVAASRRVLLGVLDALLASTPAVGSEIRAALREDAVLSPCTRAGCSGQLIMRKGKTGKRFVGCTAYPECTQSFPLPQKGSITATEKKCVVCQQPVILLKFTRGRGFETCVNMNCASKDAWKKKSNAVLNETSEKPVNPAAPAGAHSSMPVGGGEKEKVTAKRKRGG